MSVIRMKADDGEARPQSGGAMDRVVAPTGLPKRIKIAIGAGLAVVAAVLFYLFAPTASSQTVAADRVTVSTVERGTFEDFLPLRARVTPLVTVFLDAVEGGRVEQVLVEDGAMVQKGQLLAVLSNSDLQLNLLARQTEVRDHGPAASVGRAAQDDVRRFEISVNDADPVSLGQSGAKLARNLHRLFRIEPVLR